MRLMRTETITSISKKFPVGCQPAVGDLWLKDRNVSGDPVTSSMKLDFDLIAKMQSYSHHI